MLRVAWRVAAAAFVVATLGDAAPAMGQATPAAPGIPIGYPVPRDTTSINVSWTAVSGAATYDVRYGDFNQAQSSNWVDGPQGVTGTSTTITGLMHGRYYAFQVRGVNSAATAGAWSTSGQTYTNSKTEQLPANYPLVPSGVGPGDSFRLVYVTADTTRADSRYSQPYSDFVITSIETIFNNGELLGNLHVPFSQSPLVSTPGVSAQLTTDTTWTSADKGVPIYWLNGNKVADDYEDFYDGSWDDEANPKNDLGNDIAIAAANQPWTGSSSGGAELVESGGTWAAEAGGKALRFRVVGKLKSDETGPTVTSGSVAASGTSIALTFSENLDLGTNPVAFPPCSRRSASRSTVRRFR